MTVRKNVFLNKIIQLSEGYLKEVEKLIQNGDDLNAKDENGQTALHYASQMGTNVNDIPHHFNSSK